MRFHFLLSRSDWDVRTLIRFQIHAETSNHTNAVFKEIGKLLKTTSYATIGITFTNIYLCSQIKRNTQLY